MQICGFWDWNLKHQEPKNSTLKIIHLLGEFAMTELTDAMDRLADAVETLCELIASMRDSSHEEAALRVTK